MANVKPPSNYNMEDLYLYCELSSYPEIGGSRVDFSGIKTYNIGFMKEGLGFGITNVNVEITPSMQPIVEISFKDFYGNLAIEFRRNSDFLNGIVDSSGLDSLNYSSMFELPYPKFKLTFKGYLGKPAALDLNVKRIDVTYNATDGSYEIKATFIPNLYGFFSDLPFNFLKSVKYLINQGKKNEPIANEYYSIFDILETGIVLQQQQQIVNKSVDPIKRKLEALYNLSDSVFDDDFDWFVEPAISNIVNDIPIPGMDKPIFINVGKHLSRNDTGENTSLETSSKYGTINKNNLKTSNTGKGYSNVILSSVSTTKETDESKLVYFYGEKHDTQKAQEAKVLLKKSIDACDAYEKTLYTTGNKELIKKVTIKSVFDLLIRDSAYLMGRILEAGRQGYLQNQSDRDLNKTNIIGLYFPMTEDETNNEQVPYANSGPEFNFVNIFIKALSQGLSEEKQRALTSNVSELPDDFSTQLKKRITNLEIGAQNPYTLSPSSTDIVRNILERTGLIAHFFMENISNGSDETTKAIASELENINEGLKKTSKESKIDIKSFCDFIKAEIDEDGELKDSKFMEDTDKLNKITSRLSATSKINQKTLKATEMFNNNLFYVYPYSSSKLTTNSFFVIFRAKNSQTNTTLIDSSDTTTPYESDNFKFKPVDAENQSDVEKKITKKRLIDFDKLQKYTQNKSTSEETFNSDLDLNNILFSEILNPDYDLNGKYVYANYISLQRNHRNHRYVWDFGGSTNEAELQRFILLQICKKIKGQIEKNENDAKEEIAGIVERLSDAKAYNIFYTQFHHLCNNWKNLSDSENINVAQYVLDKFWKPTEGSSNVFYEIPLQKIQGNKIKINLENALVNIDSIRQSNEQSSVLNVMSNLCIKNNFMFLAIPGLGENKDKPISTERLEGLFDPYTHVIDNDDNQVVPGNHFYVLWMPTPENRVKYNNGEPLSLKFDNNIQGEQDVFEIDYGSAENSTFKSITMSTEDNKMTSEAAIAINNIADPKNSKQFKSYDCSALSVMEGRSYKISVEMIGNAQIKPTQFFVLNSTHIFSGLYQVMKVSHTLKPNDMSTKFEAMKMKYSGKGSEFIFIAPITTETLGIDKLPANNDTPVIQTEDVIITESEGFPVNQSTIKTYIGSITHPSIPISRRALLDTVSFLDNGIPTKFQGYDVLVGSTSKNPRLIEDFVPTYDQGMDFDKWKIRVNSPTLGKVVNTSASGRYQIVYTTWRDSSSMVSVPFTGNVTNPNNPPFNQDNQDIVADFLLTSRLKRGGFNTADVVKARYDFQLFIKILKSLKGEWESVALLFRNGKFKGMTIKDVYDFFNQSYNVYDKK